MSEAIRRQLAANLPVQTEAVISGKEYMLCFNPLSMNNWYTVVLMSKEDINQHIAVLLDNNINVLLIQVLIPLILLCLIFFLAI